MSSASSWVRSKQENNTSSCFGEKSVTISYLFDKISHRIRVDMNNFLLRNTIRIHYISLVCNQLKFVNIYVKTCVYIGHIMCDKWNYNRKIPFRKIPMELKRRTFYLLLCLSGLKNFTCRTAHFTVFLRWTNICNK